MRRVLLVLLPIALLALGACGVAPAPNSPWVDDMLGQVNARRAEAGVPPLQQCGTLMAAAQGHSDYQASVDDMSHTGSGGSKVGRRASDAGYVGFSALAENVAAGYPDVGAVMGGWMSSTKGHRENLLSSTYQHIGVGLAHAANGKAYWTQVFGADGSC